jgi:hypothetical protein
MTQGTGNTVRDVGTTAEGTATQTGPAGIDRAVDTGVPQTGAKEGTPADGMVTAAEPSMGTTATGTTGEAQGTATAEQGTATTAEQGTGTAEQGTATLQGTTSKGGTSRRGLGKGVGTATGTAGE